VLIGAVDVLQPLYRRVLVPQTVAGELQDANTPATVRSWIVQPPQWCEIRPDPPLDPALRFLDAGEHAAITLALSVNANRAEAERRHLLVTGTLGVLAEAHRAGLLDFEIALAQLHRTNFYMSADLVERVRRRLSTREREL